MPKYITRFILPVFILWRVGLIIVAIIGDRFLPFVPRFPYVNTLLMPSGLPSWVWQWANFDGVHYLTIAQVGYKAFATQVFFPLYPILISLLTYLTGNVVMSGILISNACIFLAAIVLYKFVADKFTESAAKWTVLFLFAFPTSFFFGSVYPESLFLLLILLSFTAKGIWAGVFAGLASGTKLIGVFLAPALVLLKPRNIWGILGATGLIAYVVFLWQKFNSPLMFLSAQSAFENNRASDITNLVLPPQVIYRYLKIFATANITHFDFWVAGLEFSAFIFGICALAVMTKRKLVSNQILFFSWAALILPAFSGTLSSMPRYLLPIFPLFIFLGTIKNTPVKYSVLAVSVLLLGILTALQTQAFFIS